eukprot:TRINITY_DN8935_c1_g1_i2.p1 TRINITY_DN8935_c1_g1~~TRINITY_DN8935_c1_g1_i2.p1  ORF type:complete len:1141 (+),score=211.16 TRINITY_DN8935_c1_g1_i2:187-3609(+)
MYSSVTTRFGFQSLSESLIPLLFLCWILNFSAFAVSDDAIAVERSVLFQFKAAADHSGLLSGWNLASSDHCSWFGVSCDSESRIVSINISDSAEKIGNSEPFSCSGFSGRFLFPEFGNCSGGRLKLAGKLPASVGKLSRLRVLSLPFNDFEGEIPAEIWGLENLEVMDLEGNSVSGVLPSEFGGLRKLRILNLGFNRISGEIPVSLSSCVGLEILNLAGNRLNGTIPRFLGEFAELQGLYLSLNQLGGSVPDEIGNGCRNLEHLDLSGNLLVGAIPLNLGNCGGLRTLRLVSNRLVGVIPPDLGRLRMLEVLDVSRNSLSGLIPPELGNCIELEVLVLSNLYDPLPPRVNVVGAQNSFIEYLNVTYDDFNYFPGGIPNNITTLPKLKILWAPEAMLEGVIPIDWGACHSLEMVNLGHNYFTGGIPRTFGGCENLHFLDLSSNKLNGSLHVKLRIPCMTMFDVSGNHLSGSIPRFIYDGCTPLHVSRVQPYSLSSIYSLFFIYRTLAAISFPSFGSTGNLAIFHNFGENNFLGPPPPLPIATERLGKHTVYAVSFSGNILTGPFPGYLSNKCFDLGGLIANFSNNKISGEIPAGIGERCGSLRLLDIAGNQITGSIPATFGYLDSLVSLDMSRNRLKGQIPECFSQLKALRSLSLAGNELSGSIPSGLSHLSSLEVLDLSSNSLSGEIPRGLVNLKNLTVLLLSNNTLSGHIPSGLANVTSLSAFNVSFNNLSGSVPLNADSMKCDSVVGNPFLRNCRIVSLSVTPPDLRGESGVSQEYANSPSASVAKKSGSSGFTPIEIASITSASAIVTVLLLLVILFLYKRKCVPKPTVHVAKSMEVMIFTDIGVPLTFEMIMRATNNFNTSNRIGIGGFGETYKAEVSPRVPVAIKRLSVGKFQGVQQFQAEIKTLGRVRHPNLVTLIGFHASDTEMFLIYNYLPGGNLENFIQERSSRGVCWKMLHKIALDIARALAYLHDQCPRVLHRDVKPSNILLDNDFNAYLSDFGLARLLGTSETHATTGVAGTFGYVAPEYALTCRVSDKADVYSYGVVLLELISDKKALDPSFSTYGNGFNIVAWACMLLRQGRACEVFSAALWDAGPHDDLVETLHLAVMCTVETLSVRPTMKQVVRRLKQLQPPTR